MSEKNSSVRTFLTSPNHIILIINVLAFFATDLLLPLSDRIYRFGWLDWQAVFSGQWYRLLTYMFLHADAEHIVGNMLMVLLVGDILENYYGKIRYLILYFSTGILAGLTSIVYNSLLGNYAVGVGASGAGFGLMGGLICVLACNGGRVNGYTLKRILIYLALSLVSGMLTAGIDNMAHLGGLVAGLVIGGILLLSMKIRRTRA